MIGIPFIARGFAVILMFIGVALAAENTLISAEVLSNMSGASSLPSVAIAVACTGIEMAAASSVIRGGSFKSIGQAVKTDPIATLTRLFFSGIVLALTYHLDIYTTYLHPEFRTDYAYFFIVVVGFFVFGPEICLIIGWWLWLRAGDEETKLLAKTNAKAIENAYLTSKRRRGVAMAIARGQADADQAVANRWGSNN